MQTAKSLGKKKKEKQPKQPKQPIGKRLIRYWPLYVMLLPAIIYYALICYVPMAGSVLAFKDYSFNKGIWGSPWVGLKYFKTFFESYDAPRLILNTFRIGFIKCVLEFPFAIILALMLNEIRNMKFKKVTQTITYLPHFLSSVIIVTMLQRILAPDTGILNQLIAGMGGDGGTFFMMDAKYFLKILFSMDLWRNIGWDSIIYLAAISSVDTALYEAAEMDGCGKLKNVAYYTAGNPGNHRPAVHYGHRRSALLGRGPDLASAYTGQYDPGGYAGCICSPGGTTGRTVWICNRHWAHTGRRGTDPGCDQQ